MYLYALSHSAVQSCLTLSYNTERVWQNLMIGLCLVFEYRARCPLLMFQHSFVKMSAGVANIAHVACTLVLVYDEWLGNERVLWLAFSQVITWLSNLHQLQYLHFLPKNVLLFFVLMASYSFFKFLTMIHVESKRK